MQAHAGHSFHFWRPARKEEELRAPARKILEQVGLGARADVIAANLAHGEQRQLEIAMALATSPRLLLHDMDAVVSLADRISVLVYGRIIATGAPREIRANPEVRAAYLGEDA